MNILFSYETTFVNQVESKTDTGKSLPQYLLCIHETGGHGGTRVRGGKASLLLSLYSTAAGPGCRRESVPGLDLEDPEESKAPKVRPQYFLKQIIHF